MKNSKSLFEKRIELKTCQINGGRLASTIKQTTCSTSGGRDTTSTTTYEDGSWQTLTHYD